MGLTRNDGVLLWLLDYAVNRNANVIRLVSSILLDKLSSAALTDNDQ